jgi:hypothetical protein
MVGLEVHIELISVLVYIILLLVSDIVIHHSDIQTSSSHEESSRPKVFISCGSSSAGMFIVERYGRLPFEFSDDTWYRDSWWNFELKMYMIFHEMTLKFFYPHLFEKIIDDASKL